MHIRLSSHLFFTSALVSVNYDKGSLMINKPNKVNKLMLVSTELYNFSPYHNIETLFHIPPSAIIVPQALYQLR